MVEESIADVQSYLYFDSTCIDRCYKIKRSILDL